MFTHLKISNCKGDSSTSYYAGLKLLFFGSSKGSELLFDLLPFKLSDVQTVIIISKVRDSFLM